MSESEIAQKSEKKGGKTVWLWVLLIVALVAGYFVGAAIAKNTGLPEDAAVVMADLKAKLEAEKAQRKDLQDKLEGVSKLGNVDIEAVANFRRETETKIQGLQGDLLNERTASAELAAENTALKETLVAATAAVTDMRANLTKSQHLETDLEKAISDLSAAKLDADKLQKEIAAQTAAIAQKDAKLAAQDADIAAKTQQLAQKTALIQSLEGKIATMTIQVNDLTTQLKVAQDEIVKLIKGRGAPYDTTGRPFKFRRTNTSGDN